jgi:8-oxo-dGTP pyrophosphatase MutT (NUDIX family)
MARDEYHIVVHVWTRNSSGEYLISKRTPNKNFPNMWECTSGSAVIGEDSITAAIREVKEELGADLLPANGRIFKQYISQNQFTDVWIFKADIPIENIILQDGETCDALWATKDKIKQMIDDGKFIDRNIYPYIDELFET